jgi:hypothetical protein
MYACGFYFRKHDSKWFKMAIYGTSKKRPWVGQEADEINLIRQHLTGYKVGIG